MSSPPGPPSFSRATVQLAQRMHLDRAAADTVAGLRRAGIRSILLKGALHARLLYDDDARCTYRDVDLLVSRADRSAAERVLRGLGFVRLVTAAHGDHWWRAGDGTIVDLHVTLPGVGVPPQLAWDVLVRHVRAYDLGRSRVDGLDSAGVALHVALHAAHHGREEAKPLRDLERALERLPAEAWREAQDLAGALEAARDFGLGLGLVPRGAALAEALGAARGASVKAALDERKAGPAALTLHAILEAPGLRAKLRLAAMRLAPTPTYMRDTYPLARSGRAALALSYLRRLGHILRSAAPAVRAWRQARDEVRGRRP